MGPCLYNKSDVVHLADGKIHMMNVVDDWEAAVRMERICCTSRLGAIMVAISSPRLVASHVFDQCHY